MMGLHFDDGVTPLSSHLINQILNLWLHHSYQLLAWFMIRIVVNFCKGRKSHAWCCLLLVYFACRSCITWGVTLNSLNSWCISFHSLPSFIHHCIHFKSLPPRQKKILLRHHQCCFFLLLIFLESFEDSSSSTDKTQLHLINILKQSEVQGENICYGAESVWTLMTHNLLFSCSPSSHIFVDNLELDEQHLFGF